MGRAEDLFKRLVDSREAAIDELIANRQSEELFLDFKRSADGGAGLRLHDRDWAHLARAIAGFANSEGGVLVWGVDCSRRAEEGDVAREKVGLQNPKRFASWLEAAVSACTVPAHPNVRHHAIEAGKPGSGFVVTYVARSHLAPHQTVRPPQYFIRAGSSFVPAPHGVLAGLFGRPPQPFVFHSWNISPEKRVLVSGGSRAKFKLGFVLASFGPGIARDLYVNVQIHPPKGHTEIAVALDDPNNWTGRNMYGGILTNLVSSDSFKLAPGGRVQVLSFLVETRPPFESDLFYEISFGHGSSPMRMFQARITPIELSEAYEAFTVEPANPEVGRKLVEQVMRLDAGNIYASEGYGQRP